MDVPTRLTTNPGEAARTARPLTVSVLTEPIIEAPVPAVGAGDEAPPLVPEFVGANGEPDFDPVHPPVKIAAAANNIVPVHCLVEHFIG
jgi:hypothetical protein